jgi:ribonuclease P protein component
LLRRGTRTKQGSIELIYLNENTKVPCLAFAIPKTVGTAVVRNKIRRQYREEFRKLVSRDPEIIPEGNYLIKVYSTKEENLPKIELLGKALKDLKIKNEHNEN